MVPIEHSIEGDEDFRMDLRATCLDGPQALGATVIAIVSVALAWINKFRAQ